MLPPINPSLPSICLAILMEPFRTSCRHDALFLTYNILRRKKACRLEPFSQFCFSFVHKCVDCKNQITNLSFLGKLRKKQKECKNSDNVTRGSPLLRQLVIAWGCKADSGWQWLSVVVSGFQWFSVVCQWFSMVFQLLSVVC